MGFYGAYTPDGPGKIWDVALLVHKYPQQQVLAGPSPRALRITKPEAELMFYGKLQENEEMVGMPRVSLAAETSCVSSSAWTLLNSEGFMAKSYELGLITGIELLECVSLHWEVAAV